MVPGYGGREGFSVYQTHDMMGSDQRVDAYSQAGLSRACAEMIHALTHNTTAAELHQMGFLKIEVDRGGEKVVMVVVKLSGRRISFADIEHMMCKIYLSVASYRGSRSWSIPNPWRAHCHPSKNESTFANPKIVQIFQEAVDSFKSMYNSGKLDSLSEPFVMSVDIKI